MKAPSREEIMARLAAFARLERKITDEVGWIAFAYGATRVQAARWIRWARRGEKRKGE